MIHSGCYITPSDLFPVPIRDAQTNAARARLGIQRQSLSRAAGVVSAASGALNRSRPAGAR